MKYFSLIHLIYPDYLEDTQVEMTSFYIYTFLYYLLNKPCDLWRGLLQLQLPASIWVRSWSFAFCPYLYNKTVNNVYEAVKRRSRPSLSPSLPLSPSSLPLSVHSSDHSHQTSWDFQELRGINWADCTQGRHSVPGDVQPRSAFLSGGSLAGAECPLRATSLNLISFLFIIPHDGT